MSVTSTSNEHVVLKADAAFKHWPIGYLPSDYRLPSLSIEQLWRAWFTPSSSSPALMGICGKMLPAGEDANVRVNEIRQLSRYTNVIKAIKGRMEVSSDQVMASFKVAWRLAAIAAVPSTAIRPAAVAATPPAAKRRAEIASRSAKHARTI